ncbi:MAG: hypothetical protein H6648_08235 [Caldilineae bacterium]|nr:hypothetical protein [Caldilineae bacterium]
MHFLMDSPHFRTTSVFTLVCLLQTLIASLVGFDSQARQAAPAGDQLVVEDQFGGATRAVVMVGAHAYVGLGHRVVVLDLSDPAAPTAIAWGPVLSTRIAHLAWADDRLYVATDYHGITVFEASSEPTLELLGDAPVLESYEVATCMAVEAGRVLLSSPRRLLVLDLREPGQPILQAEDESRGAASGLALRGDRGYIAQPGGLVVVDLGQAGVLPEIQRVELPQPVRDMLLSDDVAVVSGNRSNGIMVVDLGGVSARLMTTLGLPHEAHAISLSGTHLFASESGKISTVDIAQPESPRLLGTFDTPTEVNGVIEAIDIAAGSGYVSVVDEFMGYSLFDASDPEALVRTGRYQAFTTANAVALGRDGLLGVQDFRSGLHMLDTEDSDGVQWLTLAGFARGDHVAIRGDQALVTGSKLHIVDIGNPLFPSLLGSADLGGNGPTDLVFDSNLALVTHSAGLSIFDLTNPADPRREALVPLSGGGVSVALVGTKAFLTTGSAELAVLDIQNPGTPVLQTQLRLPSRGVDIESEAGVIYIALRSHGWISFDVSVPAAPQLLWQEEVPDDALALAIQSGEMIVAGAGGQLEWFDLSDPIQPTHVDTWIGQGYFEDVILSNEKAFVSGGPSGLWIYRLGQLLPSPSPTASQTESPTPTATDLASATPTPGDITPSPSAPVPDLTPATPPTSTSTITSTPSQETAWLPMVVLRR